MIFIDRLKEALDLRGISQYKLCKDLDIGQSTISSWKKGKIPSADKVVAIVRYLEVSADWILGIEGKTPEEFTLEEKELINAYRSAAPAIQTATRKLLDLPEPKPERSSILETG